MNDGRDLVFPIVLGVSLFSLSVAQFSSICFFFSFSQCAFSLSLQKMLYSAPKRTKKIEKVENLGFPLSMLSAQPALSPQRQHLNMVEWLLEVVIREPRWGD